MENLSHMKWSDVVEIDGKLFSKGLIAAAPDLLAAAEGAAEACERAAQDYDEPETERLRSAEDCAEAAMNLRAAIAKARREK